MEWHIYEQVTRYIYETLGREAGVKIIGHGSNCKVKGKSGLEHQIDVLTSHSDGVHDYRTAIECKYWQEKVNKDIIMKVAEIVEDAGINKGVIVSKMGYTKDAITFAEYKKIGLVELRELRESDWNGRLRIFDIKAWTRKVRILNVIIDNLGPSRTPENADPTVFRINTRNGKIITLQKLIDKFKDEVKQSEIGKQIEKYYPIVGAKIINTKDNQEIKIKGVKIFGMLVEEDAGIKFHPIDEIWMIMKLIFEEKTYTISKNGIIKEDRISSS